MTEHKKVEDRKTKAHSMKHHDAKKPEKTEKVEKVEKKEDEKKKLI
jgi:hypothetical protein